jgi:hypothetical protein
LFCFYKRRRRRRRAGKINPLDHYTEYESLTM